MISIVIATYEQKGEGEKYLTALLRSIRMQKVTVPYEVVVSDNSADCTILAVTQLFKDLWQK